MKLAIVTRTFPPDVFSGRETVIHALWKQARLHDPVTLISGWRHSRDGFPPECELINQSSSSRFVNYARFFLDSARLVRELKPDVVLSNAIELGLAPCPSAVIVHDLNFGRPGTHFVRRVVVRRRLDRFNLVIAVSHVTAGRLARLGIPPARIAVIPNGVDLERFCPGEAGGGNLPTLVCPSRITPGKGQHLLIEAMRRMHADNLAQLRVVIVGYVESQVYLAQLRRAAAGLPVEFHTNVADIVPYYRMADLVVFPTIMEEGFGLAAAEAMACGKPAIWSDDPAVREATGGTGLAVPPDDAAALAHAIESLLRDKGRLAALGKAGREYAVEHYSWAKVYDKYRQVLCELAGEEK